MSELGIRLHIRLPIFQISERFDDAAFDMADDDQRVLPSFRLTFQDRTFRLAESVMIVIKNRGFDCALFIRSICRIQKLRSFAESR